MKLIAVLASALAAAFLWCAPVGAATPQIPKSFLPSVCPGATPQLASICINDGAGKDVPWLTVFPLNHTVQVPSSALNIIGALQENTVIPLAGVTMQNAPATIVDLFTNPVPPNYFGASGGGAVFSFCLTNTGCVPGDHERGATFQHVTSKTDASIQEFATFIQMDAVTGKAPFWTSSTAFAANDEMVNGANLYRAAAACTTSPYGTGPTGSGTAIVDGSCSWAYVTNSITNGKTALGVATYSGPGSGSSWVVAFDHIRAAGGDPTRFSATMEVDSNFYDTVDHQPGTPYGDAYGVLQSGFGSGIGSVGYAMSTANSAIQTSLSTTTGSATAIVGNPYGIYPHMRIYGYGIPVNTTVSAIVGNTVTMSSAAVQTQNYTASFVTFMWHWGFAVVSPFTVSDYGFLNSSNDTDGFFNNGSNVEAGFADRATSAGFGFLAAGTYSTAAFDATPATTAYGLRLNANQGVTFKAGDWNFQYSSASGLFTLTVNGTQPWYIDQYGAQYATSFHATSGYASNGISGVSCSGTPTTSHAVTLGIVTHC